LINYTIIRKSTSVIICNQKPFANISVDGAETDMIFPQLVER